MSTPTTSTGPTPPSGASNPVPLRGWFKAIGDWIVGLSPAGATVYDTGWVSVAPGAGFTAVGAQVRRIGPQVFFRGYFSGGALSTSGTAVGTVPTGFIPPGGVDHSASAIALGNGATARATVSGSGVISVIPPANATTAVYLKGLSGCTVN